MYPAGTLLTIPRLDLSHAFLVQPNLQDSCGVGIACSFKLLTGLVTSVSGLMDIYDR